MRVQVLDFLRRSFPDRSGEHTTVEYRLMCSGTLHRSIIGDWTRSDAARLISPTHFELFVCNARIDEYPQELALRFSCPSVREVYGTWAFDHRPDGEIAADLAALFTLFCRRLVTVAGKVRELFPPNLAELPEAFRDRPSPIYGARFRYWSARPATVITSPEVIEGNLRVRQEVRSHEPGPVPVEPASLKEFLDKVSSQVDKSATCLVLAARRYQEALRYIPENVDLSYLLLVSAIEAVSGEALSGFKPPPETIVEDRADMVKHLRSLSISETEIFRIIEIVSKRERWVKEKFVRFIENYVPDDVWNSADPLYPGLEFAGLVPDRQDLRGTLTRIYEQRSASSHRGIAYPPYVAIGTSPWMTDDAFRALMAAAQSDRIPPVTWFERLTQATLITFVRSLS